MKKIAITGNIASGKSEVEKIISSSGFKVLDTDMVSHDILENNSDAKNEIISFFGSKILDDNNNISRRKLGEIVFRDNDKLTRLERIIHPLVFKKIGEFFSENSNEEMCFVSVPQLFETKTQIAFDKVVFISSKEENRLKRLMERNNLTQENAQLRIDAQMGESEKIKHSDFVIYNDKDLDYLKEQVLIAIALLRLLP